MSSTVSPSRPSVKSRYAICGCASVLRKRCRQVISTDWRRAPAVWSVCCAPLKRWIVRPSSLAMSSSREPATRSTSGWRRLERLAFGERPTLGYRFLGERGVPLPGLRQRPGERRDVGRHLVAHGLVDGLATRRNRMRCADVRRRRHGGHVCGNGDQKPCRGRPAPLGAT